MFIARKNELRKVKSFLSSDDNAMLVYGKWRVGKTRLIKEALKDFDGIVVSYQCTAESYEINLEYFTAEVKASFSIPFLSFKTFYEAFVFFVSQKKRILVVIDEYGELKTAYGAYATDSMFQKIIDMSSITMMPHCSIPGFQQERKSLSIQYLEEALMFLSSWMHPEIWKRI